MQVVCRALMLAVVCSASVGCPTRPSIEKLDGESLTRFAAEGFVAACQVRPKEWLAHPFWGSLPVHAVLHDRLSPDRLKAMNVDELILFVGVLTAGSATGEPKWEWGAAARLAEPKPLADLLAQWRRLPREESQPAPVEIELKGIKCWRVAAGSILPPRRRYGQLRFTDRLGLPVDRGIHVGRVYDYRGYVEGDSKAEAIFSLERIAESDLVDGRLPLELRLDVFPTYHLDHEYPTAEIELRNPDTGLRSAPIAFQPKSYTNQRMDVPRKLSAPEGQTSKTLDLLHDLVSQGRLEVVLRVKEAAIYIGAGPQDLNVQVNPYEYVFVAGRDIVVAQSPATLLKMLQAAGTPSSLAKRLSQGNQGLVGAVAVENDEQRRAWHHFVSSLIDEQDATLFGQELVGLTLSCDMSESASTTLSAEFANSRSARQASGQVSLWRRRAKDHARSTIEHALNRLDTIASLQSLALNGVSMRFPDPDKHSAETRALQVQSIIDDLLNQVDIETHARELAVSFRPPERLSRLSDDAQIAVANCNEVLALDLFQREECELSDDLYRRVTERFPQVPQVWFRRAHQLSYNVLVEWEGYDERYGWLRRGVDVLLDGAEQNPDSPDFLWMAARFVGWKVGDSDDRLQFRQRFAEDGPLQDRLKKWLDLPATRSPKYPVDNWLVARNLFDDLVERYPSLPATSTIAPLQFFARPAEAQARYAQAMSEAGFDNEALAAWKNAEDRYRALGDLTISLADGNTVRLNDLSKRQKELGATHADVKRIQNARNFVQFDYWLARCKLEQSEELRRIARLSREAKEQLRRDDFARAHAASREALLTIAELRQREPAIVSHVLNDFKGLAASYRQAAEALKADEPTLADLLLSIEQARSPFMLDYNDNWRELLDNPD